jgi:hypothetical protein
MVRVVGEEIEPQVMSIQDALRLADKWNLIWLKSLRMLIHLYVKLLIIRNTFTKKKETKRAEGKSDQNSRKRNTIRPKH